MTFLPLARPTIGDAEVAAQERALRSGRLVLGPENAAFEAGLAAVTGAPHVVAVASGTAALHAALWALDPMPGEILVPAFTFPAPANAAASLGFDLVPVDVEPGSWNMDPAAAAKALSRRTRGIIAVDQFGLVADLARLEQLAADAKVPLIEDAACALGGVDARGRRAGTMGAVGCFSFHPRKIITTGEGGALVTADAALAEKLRLLRHHGIRAPGEFATVGLNFRLPETCAAVGRAQLERLPALLAGRARLVAQYREALAGLPLRLQEVPAGVVPTWQTFAVVLPAGASRDRVIAHLRTREIEAGPATYALHRVGSFAGRAGFTRARLPVADELHDHALALPLYAELTDDDIGRVAAALREALA